LFSPTEFFCDSPTIETLLGPLLQVSDQTLTLSVSKAHEPSSSGSFLECLVVDPLSLC
jgi:hypothetical protein